MNRIKVVHIITMLELGGAQKNTLYTVSHLDRDLFEPVLVTGPGGILDAETAALEKGGVKVHFVKNLVRPVKPLQDLLCLIYLVRFLKEEKPGIVHTHSSKAGIIGRIAAYLAGCPVIIHTYHGFGFNDRQFFLVKWFFVRLERLVSGITGSLIFVSESNRGTAASLNIGNPGKYILIRSGVNLRQCRDMAAIPVQSLRHKFGYNDSEFIVMTVGPFKPQKNLGDFIKIAAIVTGKIKKVRFLVVGDGEERPKLEELIARLGLSDTVSLLGWRQDVPELLRLSNTFLLTSLWEGLPRALVEAMAVGTVPLAYAVDGIRDLIVHGKNGFIFNTGDVEGVAHELIGLAGKPEKTGSLSIAAMESVNKEFDIDWMVERITKLYNTEYMKGVSYASI